MSKFTNIIGLDFSRPETVSFSELEQLEPAKPLPGEMGQEVCVEEKDKLDAAARELGLNELAA